MKKFLICTILFIITLYCFNQTSFAQLYCKVKFCNCCGDTNISYDVYDMNGNYSAGFTTNEPGGCHTGVNLAAGQSYLVRMNCHGRSYVAAYFTACVCLGGYDSVMLPCCPGSDNLNDLNHSLIGVIPKDYALYQNFPNPFNPTTKIVFDLPKDENVKVTIYDLAGKQVEVLLEGFVKSGVHELNWDAKSFSSGVYLYKLEAGNFVSEKKMILVK